MNVRYFKSIEGENNVLKGKLWDFRNRSQQGNLCFDGMVEYKVDYWTDTEENVKDFLCRLNIQRVITEWAHIIGKPKDDGWRTIVAKFHKFFMIRSIQNLFSLLRVLL